MAGLESNVESTFRFVW